MASLGGMATATTPMSAAPAPQSTASIAAKATALYTWGDGARGALGHGDTACVMEPERVSALSKQRIVSVSCGSEHTVVLAASGDVFSFGSGAAGALGHGEAESADCCTPKMIEALQGKSVTAIGAGGRHSAAVTVTGTLYTWGTGADGQLAMPDSTPDATATCWKPRIVPFTAHGMSMPAAVTCSAHNTALLLKNGTLVTCGLGGPQLGHEDVLDATDGPRKANPLLGEHETTAIGVALGEAHMAMVTHFGAALTCGSNGRYQLGARPPEQGKVGDVRELVALSKQKSAAAAAAGAAADGAGAAAGAAGAGAGAAAAAAQQQPQPPSGAGAAAAAAGRLGKPGASASSGSPDAVSRRRGLKLLSNIVTTETAAAPKPSAPWRLALASKERITQVACGAQHTLAVSAVNGVVYSWGEGRNGQLGHDEFLPEPMPRVVAGLRRSMAALEVSGRARRTPTGVPGGGGGPDGGTPLSAGPGPGGGAGRASLDPFTPTTPSNRRSVDSVAESTAGALEAAARSPRLQQLHADGGAAALAPSPAVWERPPVTSSPVSVCAGGSHSLVVMDDGTLYAFGLASDGQLGTGLSFARRCACPMRVEALARPGLKVLSVAAGMFHSAAIVAEDVGAEISESLYHVRPVSRAAARPPARAQPGGATPPALPPAPILSPGRTAALRGRASAGARAREGGLPRVGRARGGEGGGAGSPLEAASALVDAHSPLTPAPYVHASHEFNSLTGSVLRERLGGVSKAATAFGQGLLRDRQELQELVSAESEIEVAQALASSHSAEFEREYAKVLHDTAAQVQSMRQTEAAARAESDMRAREEARPLWAGGGARTLGAGGGLGGARGARQTKLDPRLKLSYLGITPDVLHAIDHPTSGIAARIAAEVAKGERSSGEQAAGVARAVEDGKRGGPFVLESAARAQARAEAAKRRTLEDTPPLGRRVRGGAQAGRTRAARRAAARVATGGAAAAGSSSDVLDVGSPDASFRSSRAAKKPHDFERIDGSDELSTRALAAWSDFRLSLTEP